MDLDHDGWVSVNDILIEEGHAYEYFGGKKKDFESEMVNEKAQAKLVKGKEE
jgi:endonuclease YncB( thermonuclease family)